MFRNWALTANRHFFGGEAESQAWSSATWARSAGPPQEAPWVYNASRAKQADVWLRKVHFMSRKVADVLWEMLANAGVKRCYGIVGDALNPVIDALRRNGQIEFIHVRHEEYGVFAAVAEAYMTGQPVAVCGTAG